MMALATGCFKRLQGAPRDPVVSEVLTSLNGLINGELGL